MRVSKCCCFDLRTGSIIIIILDLLGSISGLLTGNSHLAIDILGIIIFGSGLIAIFKVNQFFCFVLFQYYFLCFQSLVLTSFVAFFSLEISIRIFPGPTKMAYSNYRLVDRRPIIKFTCYKFNRRYESRIGKKNIRSEQRE